MYWNHKLTFIIYVGRIIIIEIISILICSSKEEWIYENMSAFSIRLISRQTKNSSKLYRDSKATSNLFFLMFFALGQLHLYHISKCEIYHWQLKKDFPLQAFYSIWIVLTFQIACHFSAWLKKPRGFYIEVIFAPDAKKVSLKFCLPKRYFTFVCQIFCRYCQRWAIAKYQKL